MITFNNIVERFQIFAENHFFVQTFSFGSPDDVDLSKFTNFPLMHLVYTGATYDAGTKTYNLEVYILDVPADKNQKVERQKEVVSDAEQCAEDIIADIKNGGNIFLFAQDYEVVNATTTPLEEETKNVLSGVLLDLSVAIPYEWDACNAPIDGVEPGGTAVTYARRGVLRMLTLDGATDVSSVRTIKVTNGTLTDDGDGVVTLDTGGVDTLAGLTDVDVTGVTDGQVLKYNDATSEWLPGNDQSATSLGNLDDVSLATPANREALIYDGDNWVNDNVTKADVGLGNVDNTSDADKPVSTATQTALNLKANTADVPTELNDLSDVSLTTPTANQALIYNTAASAFQALPSYTNRFQDEAEQASNTAVTGTTLFIERYYSAKADGDGIFIDAQSDTPSAGKKIERKIYQIAGGLDDSTITGWTLIHTFADDTAYSATTSTFEGFRDGDTYGTPPFSLAQTWEEVTAAPAFTGLLNESYGSGAEAAYSTRRLNGNYSGDCMTIRRASDGTTQSIGFVGEEIDESAIETFCTGTTCTVQVWRDQSGNGNDATQTTAANQPTIYTGGAIVKENGRVALDFDGANDYVVTSQLSTVAQPTTRIAVGSFDDTTTAGKGYLMDGHTLRQVIGEDPASPAEWRLYSGTINDYSQGPIESFRYLMYANFNTSSEFFIDGVSLGAKSVGTQGYDGVTIGAMAGPTKSVFHDGKIQESIIYTALKSSADQTSIESNIGDYFTQNTPLLDTYSGAAAAYSLRKLRSAYSGSAIRVRRASDNAESDIGFNVFNELDTVSLASFCSGTDGFVKVFYDQSGNANDATQTTAANQPKIYDSTTGVITENGKPAVENILSGAQGLNIPSFTINLSDFTCTLVSKFYADSSVDGKAIMINGDTGQGFDYRYKQFSITRGRFYLGTSTIESFFNNVSYTSSNNLQLHTITPTNGYVDGTSAGTFGTAGENLSLTPTFNYLTSGDIGRDRDTHANTSEVIIWTADQSSNRTNIEDNINTFYSIY